MKQVKSRKLNGMGRALSALRRGTERLWLIPVLATPLLAGDPPNQELWADPYPGEGYWDFAVSLGNNGTTVFTDTGFTSTHSRLYSAFRGSTSVPIWEKHESAEASFTRSVASAAAADVHAVIRHQVNSSGVRKAHVEVFDSSSPTPVFTYVFSDTDSGVGRNSCHVSDDGATVIACYMLFGKTHVARFDTNGPTSGGYHENGFWTISTFGPATVADVTADLQRLYLGSDLFGEVHDISGSSAVEEWSSWHVGGASLHGHSLSTDGQFLAVPVADRIDLYARESGTYVLQSSLTPFGAGANQYAHRAEISSNGRYVAGGFKKGPSWSESSVAVWDVQSGQLLMLDAVSGSAQQQTFPEDLVFSADGSRLAAAFSGVETGQIPGFKVYQRSLDGSGYDLLKAYDRPGPIYDLDISRDGFRLAATGKNSTQANGTKVVEAIDLGKDFDLRGMPRHGSQVTFEYYPNAITQDTVCFLLKAPGLETPPLTFSFGSLYVQRNSIEMISMGPIVDGMASKNILLSGSVGSTWYYQGFSFPPRRLSKAWVPVTLLP